MKSVLYKNCIIVPMTKEGLTYKYMGIKDNKIQYLGNEYVKGYKKEIDLNGRYIYPTMTDSHLHLLYSIVLAGSSFFICNFTNDGVKPDNISSVKKEISEYIKKNNKDKLVIVNQYIIPAIKEERLPNKDELDSISIDKDIVIFSMDGHSCSLNSSLLNKLKIDSKDGILSGKNYDLNQGKITSYIASSVSLKTLSKGVANFENDCLKYGISKVCALDGEDTGNKKDILLTLLILISRRMKIDVRLYPEYMDYSILNRIGKKMKWKRIGGCSKWELDGSISSNSASFYEPYKNSGKKVNLYYPDSLIDEKVNLALKNDIRLTCHAIGTCAIDQIINSYKKSQDLIPKTGPLFRIDHYEFPSKEANDFLKNNKIAITFQPGFSYIDKLYMNGYKKYLSDETLNKICPLNELIDNNVCVLGSSDSPVQSINPFIQMLGMIDYYKKEYSISIYDAFKTYTYNSYLALAEKDNCLIKGNDATFFISSYDILNFKKEDVNNIFTDSMFIRGKEIKKKRGSIIEFILMLFKIPHKI